MKHLKSVLLIVLLLASSAFAQRNFAGKVVEVVDGRTIVIEITGGGKMTASLQYIEVPESGQALHSTIRDHLGGLVLGKVVEFRAQHISTDVVIAGQLLVTGVDVSQQMLRDGAAWHMPREITGQDTAQNAEYDSNQSLAKAEKRGVWSVAGLKPAWEHRAELAAQKEEELKKEQALREMRENYEREVAERQRAQKREQTIKARQAANAQMSFWPNVGMSKIDPASNLLMEYDPIKKVGSVETRDGVLDMALGDKKEKADFRALLVYQGESAKSTGVFLIGFLIREPKKSAFNKASSLQISADKAKIAMKGAVGESPFGPNGQWNVIFYKFDKEQMTQIAYADKLEIKLAGYSATIDDKAKNSMRHLLLASN
jgi:endonuclease YncB( thermonuclease family)